MIDAVVLQELINLRIENIKLRVQLCDARHNMAERQHEHSRLKELECMQSILRRCING